jgi:hypothetical protein
MRLSILVAAIAVAAPIGLYAGTASAQFFEGQSPLFGRPHGSVYEGRWCARQNKHRWGHRRGLHLRFL